MIRDLGIVEPGTTLYLPFHTFDSNDPSASVTLTGLATTDIEIYKDGSTTQRASDAGYALLDTDGIDFDGVTGIHGLSINLADNTTAGFYAAGSQYWVVISSVTVDAATVNFVLATFRIGYPSATLNTTIATLSSQTSFTLTAGPAEDDALNGMWAVIHDVASGVQKSFVRILDYTGSTKTVTLAAGATFTAAASDNFSVMDMAPLQPTTTGRTLVVDSAGLADANVVKIGPTGSGTAQTARDIGASVLLSSGTGTGQVKLSSGYVAPNWGDVGNPTTTVSLSGTTVKTATDVETDTADIQSRLPAALVNSRMDCTIDGTGMETGAVDAILNRDASASTTNSTLGAIINDWENGGRLDLIVDDILDDTDLIDDGTSGLAKIATDVAAVLVDTGTTLDGKVNSLVNACTIYEGTAGSGSTTTLVDATLTQADADYWVGNWVKFTSGNLIGQVRLITDFVPGTDTITFAPATTQAVSTHSYVIIPAARVESVLAPNVAHGGGTATITLEDLTVTGEFAMDTMVVASGLSANITGNITGTLSTVTTLTNLPAITANWLTAAGTASDFGTEVATAVWALATRTLTAATNISGPIADQVWEEAIADHSGTAGSTAEALNAAGSAGDPWNTALPGAYTSGKAGYIVGTFLDAAISSRSTVTTAQVNTEVDTALADIHLDHLIASADPGSVVANSSFLAKLVSKSATPAFSSYDNTTDSLEALRDRGDSAWITATGFSTHSAADVWAAGTRTLTAGTNIQLPSNGLANVTAWTVAITGNITGNLSGSVGSVSGAVGSVTGNVGGNVTGSVGSVLGGINTTAGVITTLDGLDTAQDSQHSTTQGLVTTVDTVVNAVKLKTDNLPAAPAAVGDIPTAIQNADALLNRSITNTQDTADVHSLTTVVLAMLESSMSGTTWTIRKTGGTTFTTKTLTVDAGADPITGVT